MNNNEDNNSPVNKFTIIQSTPKTFAQAAQLSAIYTLVYYLASAFETLDYPWIPSYFSVSFE